MRLFALTIDQASELERHLSTVLSGEALAVAVASIDEAAAYMGVSPSEWRRTADAQREHMTAVSVAARRLRELLLGDRPLLGTADLDWPKFDHALSTVEEPARRTAEAFAPSGAGRPLDVWRDKLIATIWSVYPNDKRAKGRRSHFPEAVRLVLRFIGQDIGDVRNLIVDSLMRTRGEAPFTVKLSPKKAKR